MTTYLSLGSNLGDREQNLVEAVRRLTKDGVVVTQQSSLYETEPQDVRNQPWFLNMVVAANTVYTPDKLLRAALGVEAAMGRVRFDRRGPRIIDIDILLVDDLIFSSGELEIPHGRMTGRRFVLEPLVEIGPDLVHPRTRTPFREILAQLEGQAVERWKTG